MSTGRLFIGAVRLDCFLPGADSLKAKRAIVNKAKAALKNTLEVSVAEVDLGEMWQRAVLGAAVVASSYTGAERVTDRVAAVVERDPRLVVTGMITDIVAYDEIGELDLPPSGF